MNYAEAIIDGYNAIAGAIVAVGAGITAIACVLAKKKKHS